MSTRSQRFRSLHNKNPEQDNRRQSGRVAGHTQHSSNRIDESDEETCTEENGENELVSEAENPDQIVKKLVRYALACEYQRSTIKRTGITEKVICKQRCNFKLIFHEAQEQLRTKFGMEMVELPTREKVTLKEKKAAQKLKGNSKSSSAYILRTVLPAEYRNPLIICPSNIRSPSDEASYIAMYTVIICLISLSADKQMQNHQLDKYLRRLNLDRNTGLGTTSELLARMKKDNYIHEHKTQDEQGNTSEWRVGPRGLLEVDKKAISGFIQQIYGLNAPEDLPSRLQRSLGTDHIDDQETSI